MIKRDSNTSDFFLAYINYLTTGDSRKYKKWILHQISKQGEYRGSGRRDVVKVLKSDYDLYLNIKKNGMKQPIALIGEDTSGMNINGCHRLAIAYVLNYKRIRCVYHGR